MKNLFTLLRVLTLNLLFLTFIPLTESCVKKEDTSDLDSDFTTVPPTTAARNIQAGETVVFQDLTTGGTAPYDITWRCPGGGPSQIGGDNPQILYQTEGSYDVSLVVVDADGNIDTELKIGYITVSSGTPDKSISDPFEFDDPDLW